MPVKDMTNAQLHDAKEDTCPDCGSKNIRQTQGVCRCRGNCWTYPVCEDCGFTQGQAGANSYGGSWGSFTK